MSRADFKGNKANLKFLIGQYVTNVEFFSVGRRFNLGYVEKLNIKNVRISKMVRLNKSLMDS